MTLSRQLCQYQQCTSFHSQVIYKKTKHVFGSRSTVLPKNRNFFRNKSETEEILVPGVQFSSDVSPPLNQLLIHVLLYVTDLVKISESVTVSDVFSPSQISDNIEN